MHAQHTDDALFVPALTLQTVAHECLARVEAGSQAAEDTLQHCAKLRDMIHAQPPALWSYRPWWTPSQEQALLDQHIFRRSTTAAEHTHSPAAGELLAVSILQKCFSALLSLAQQRLPSASSGNPRPSSSASSRNAAARRLVEIENLKRLVEDICAALIVAVADHAEDYIHGLARQMHSELVAMIQVLSASSSRSYPLKLSLFDPVGLLNIPDDPFNNTSESSTRPFPMTVPSAQASRAFQISLLSIAASLSLHPCSPLALGHVLPTVVIEATAPLPSPPFFAGNSSSSVESEDSYTSHLRLLCDLITNGRHVLSGADYHALSKRIFDLFRDFVTEVVPRSSPDSPARAVAVKYLLEAIVRLRKHPSCIDPATCIVKQDGDKLVACLSSEEKTVPNVVELLCCLFLSLPIATPSFQTLSKEHPSSPNNTNLLASLLAPQLRQDVCLFIGSKTDYFTQSKDTSHGLFFSPSDTATLPPPINSYSFELKELLFDGLSELAICLKSSSTTPHSDGRSTRSSQALSSTQAVRKRKRSNSTATTTALSSQHPTNKDSSHDHPDYPGPSWAILVTNLLSLYKISMLSDQEQLKKDMLQGRDPNVAFNKVWLDSINSLVQDYQANDSNFKLIGLLACAYSGSIKSSFNAAFRCCVCDGEKSTPVFIPSGLKGGVSSTQNVSLNTQNQFRSLKVSKVISSALSTLFRSVFQPNSDKTESAKRDHMNKLALIHAFRRIIRHTLPNHNPSSASPIDLFYDKILPLLETNNKSLVLASGMVIVQMVYRLQGTADSAYANSTASKICEEIFSSVENLLSRRDQPPIVINSILIIAQIARIANDDTLSRSLKNLIYQFGNPKGIIRGIVYNEIVSLAHDRNTSSYKMFAPFMVDFSSYIISHMRSCPTLISEFMSLIHVRKDIFLRTNYSYALPTLVLNNQTDEINIVSEAMELSPNRLLLAQAGPILCKLFLQDEQVSSSGFMCFLNLLTLQTKGNDNLNLNLNGSGSGSGSGKGHKSNQRENIQNVISTCTTDLLAALVIELGGRKKGDEDKAKSAISRVYHILNPNSNTNKDGYINLLKDNLIGILAKINESLDRSRSVREKRKILFGLGTMIFLIGNDMASAAPQIMTTLQSTLEVEDLRLASLTAWNQFIHALPTSDLGPFLGQTSAALVKVWPSVNNNAEEQKLAISILNYLIVDQKLDTQNYFSDVCDLSIIPELSSAKEILLTSRKNVSLSSQLEKLASRIESDNDVISLQALTETRALLEKGSLPPSFLAGDAFDPTAGYLLKSLLHVIVKAGVDTHDARELAFTCLGTLGAVDPDRVELPPEEASYMPMSNFEEEEDSVNFALYLLEFVLVGAYRSTNDTVHQATLAYAIQGLVSFCGFDSSLLKTLTTSSNKPHSSKIVNRWKKLSKFVVETITPLLGTSFTLKGEIGTSSVQYPLYKHAQTYPQWINTWAMDLVNSSDSKSAQVFRPFQMVINHGDVRVSQQLLPHLVLNALLSDDESRRNYVHEEMMAVLRDHVQPNSNYSPDSRLLCAQTVFGLMDHVGRWMRKKRVEVYKVNKQRRRGNQNQGGRDVSLIQVESILSAMPLDLMANAAVRCKAYARALQSLEKRLADLTEVKKSDDELQATYEQLHELYAALDEPDGMEGISTKILSPSVAHRIREHESTGQWTSAQSCWEVQLQLKPDDVSSHVGMLQCLDNLGHYDSMRTHLMGVLMEHSDWHESLAPFEITVALAMGDWKKVDSVVDLFPRLTHPRIVFGKVTRALRCQSERDIAATLADARENLGAPIISAGKESYSRVYDAVVQLHMLHELCMIHSKNQDNHLKDLLESRFTSTSPTFKTREAILNMRRVSFRLNALDSSKREIGNLWLSTSKIARKARHMQTAYSAILQAEQLDTPMAFLQNAKLFEADNQTQRAIQELDNFLNPIIQGLTLDNKISYLPEGVSTHALAKAALRRARWMHETERFSQNEVVIRYKDVINLWKEWEGSYYHLGHYHDELLQNTPKDRHGSRQLGAANSMLTCQYFSDALRHGTKHIYQAMPRMLTLWLDMGDDSEKNLRNSSASPLAASANGEIQNYFVRINKIINRAIRKLPEYQWLIVFPQVVSRMTHANKDVYNNLEIIMIKVLLEYPQQALWSMVSAAKSTVQKRSARCLACFAKAANEAQKRDDPKYHQVAQLINSAQNLVDELLRLCNHQIGKDGAISLKQTFPDLYKSAPNGLIIPLQSSLTVNLPSTAAETLMHKPFPSNLTTFQRFQDEIEIMSSLVRPRKITVLGSDGNLYSFLCKPKDDLRKDARLMEFNSMINKLLKKDSESRKRHLYIRTYSVIPLNEECGLIEWVQNTVPLRAILLKQYESRGIACWTPQLKQIYNTIREDPNKTATRFEKEVLSQFPSVFHEWFLEQFPEPNAWLKSRLSYGRTIAVMSMVGFVIGLGDRHCENILFDSVTGDTVHVDFNCLFDKGRTLEVMEGVPFRLTHNIVDGLGVTGVEGVYRRAAEVAMRILRENKDSLMSVLESFVHDPLVEWTEKRKKHRAESSSFSTDDYQKKEAKKALEPIERKLKGLQITAQPLRLERPATSENQVESLIREATNSYNLGAMYVGWAAYF